MTTLREDLIVTTCRLIGHKKSKRGQMSGYTETYGKWTFSFLLCQRCGQYFPGSVRVPEYRSFP